MLAVTHMAILYICISFAAIALAAVLMIRGWNGRMTEDGFFAADGGVSRHKPDRSYEVERMTVIADTAIAARLRRQEPAAPERFGRSRKKTPIIDRRDD